MKQACSRAQAVRSRWAISSSPGPALGGGGTAGRPAAPPRPYRSRSEGCLGSRPRTLLSDAPPSAFSRCFNMDGEGASAILTPHSAEWCD